MSYFRDADDLTLELVAAFELFLSGDAERKAAAAAAAGFDIGDGSDAQPVEPIVQVATQNPATAISVILGDKARAEVSSAEQLAQVRVTADADALHDLLLENYDAGQIARAVEEHRLSVSGPPWSLDALIVLAGSFGGFYRRSLESRGRADLLNSPPPFPAGVWEVPVPAPEDFMGAVVPARRQFIRDTSK